MYECADGDAEMLRTPLVVAVGAGGGLEVAILQAAAQGHVGKFVTTFLTSSKLIMRVYIRDRRTCSRARWLQKRRGCRRTRAAA